MRLILIPLLLLFPLAANSQDEGPKEKDESKAAKESAVEEEEELMVLDPFDVHEERTRYSATLSMSGSCQAVAIRDLPRAIGVITSELIEDTNSQNILESARYSSNVYVSSASNTGGGGEGGVAVGGVANDLASRLKIRGFQTSTVYRNFNPTEYSPWGPLIDRVEIVKGPASALYGRAAPGGTVNFIKNDRISPRKPLWESRPV